MRLTMLAKDDKSDKIGCPSVYISDSGELVVQGPELDTNQSREIQNPLPGETAVRISPEIIYRAMRTYE